MFEKKILKKYFSIFIPIFISILSLFLFQIIDSFFVSKLGVETFSGFGIALIQVLFITSILSSISNSINVFISKAHGSKKEIRKKRKLYIGTFIILFSSLLVFFLFFIFKDFLYSFYGASPNVLISMEIYFETWILFIPFYSLFIYFQNSLNSIEKTFTASFIVFLSLGLNILLDYILMFGVHGMIEPLGIYGSALATGLSYIFGVLCFAYIIFKNDLIYKIPLFKNRASSLIVKKMFFLSLHFLVPGLTYPLSMIILSIGISYYSVDIIASFTLIDNLKYILLIITTSTATTVSILSSNFYGSKKYSYINKIFNLTLLIISTWSFILVLFVYFFGYNVGEFYFGYNSYLSELFSHMWFLFIFSSIFWSYTANLGRLFFSIKMEKYASSIILFGNVSTMFLPIFFGNIFGVDGFIISISAIGFIVFLISAYIYKTKTRILFS